MSPLFTTRVLDHHPSEHHDPRSVERFHIQRFIEEVPTRGRYWVPARWHLNQDASGHCGGMAAMNEGGASPFRLKPPDPILRAHQFYYAAKDWGLDPWGREDGTSTLAMMQVGQRVLWWDNYAWATTVDDLKRHLEVGPFLFGIPYYTSMFAPNLDGFCTAAGVPEGGHLMCAYGWSKNWRGPITGKSYGPTLHLDQSWGVAFGLHGRIHIPLGDDGAALLLSEGEAGVPINRKMVAVP